MSKPRIFTYPTHSGSTAVYTVHKGQSKGQWHLTLEIDGEHTYFEPFKLMRDAIAYMESYERTWQAPEITPEITPATPTQEIYTYEHAPADLVADLESPAQITPINYADAMLASVSAPAPRIVPSELIAAAILLVMLVIGSALFVPVATTAIIALMPVVKITALGSGIFGSVVAIATSLL